MRVNQRESARSGEVRENLKAMAETLAVASGAPSLARRFTRGSVRILAYHNVAPDDEDASGELTLHLPRTRFAEQLDLLMESHEIVSLESVLENEATSPSRPRAVITFDDAYQGAMTAGVAELADRKLPATVFVTPKLLGGQVFWWDRLAALAGGTLDEDIRRTALSVHDGRQEAVTRWAGSRDPEVGSPVPRWARSASADDVEAAVDVGVTLASHSWSHPNLTRLPSTDLSEELERPLSWLRRHFPDDSIPWLSYPYGLSSAEVEQAARRAGYRAAVRAEGGCAAAADPVFTLPRISIPRGLSHRGFELRISGLPLR